MLGKDKRPSSSINTLVGADTRVEGNVEFSGGFHVDGHVKGDVKAVGAKKAVLSISERGSVEGHVSAPHVVLNGAVKGNVYASERLELGPKARVDGNVEYKLIRIEVGGEVNGNLVHTGTAQATKPQPRKKASASRGARKSKDASSDARQQEAEPEQATAQKDKRLWQVNVVGE